MLQVKLKKMCIRDRLYGARIEAAVRKEGENLCIGFLSDCIDEAYAPGADGLTAGEMCIRDRLRAAISRRSAARTPSSLTLPGIRAMTLRHWRMIW